MSEKLPMMILISSPRMRRGEASDLEDMFSLGLDRLHLRKPDHSAKDVSKILDKIPVEYLDRIVLHRLPELLKDYPWLVIIIRPERSYAKHRARAAVRSIRSRTSSITRRSWTTHSLARFSIRSQSKDMVQKYRSNPFANFLPLKIVCRFLPWEEFEETR